MKGAMVTLQPMSCLGMKGWYGHTTANELSCTVEIFDDILTPSNQITKLLVIFISFMTMVHFRDVGLM